MSPDTPSGASGQGDAPTGGQRPPSKTADVISPPERPKLSSPSAGQGDAPTGGQRPPSKTADVISPPERPKLSSPSAGQTANTAMSTGQRETSSGVSGQGDAPTGGQRPLGQTADVTSPAERPKLSSPSTGQTPDVNWATSLGHPNLTPNRHALLMREERREIEKDPILSRTAKQSMLHDLELSEEAYHLSHTQTADSASRTERPVLPSASDKQATETDTSAGQPNVFSDVGRQSDTPFASQRVSEPSADVTSRAERPDLAGTAAGQVANAPTSLKQPNALSGVVEQGDTPPTNRRDAVHTADPASRAERSEPAGTSTWQGDHFTAEHGTSKSEREERSRVDTPADGVGFRSGSRQLVPGTMEHWRDRQPENIRAALSDPHAQVIITGTASRLGSDSDNLHLSQERADEVKQWLKDHGVQAPIKTIAVGEEPAKKAEKPDGNDDASERIARIEVIPADKASGPNQSRIAGPDDPHISTPDVEYGPAGPEGVANQAERSDTGLHLEGSVTSEDHSHSLFVGFSKSLFNRNREMPSGSILGAPVTTTVSMDMGKFSGGVGIQEGVTGVQFGITALDAEIRQRVGSESLGLTYGAETKILDAEVFAGYHDGTIGAEAGIDIISDTIKGGVDIEGTDVGVNLTLGIKAEMGFKIGWKTEIKAPFVSFGFEIGREEVRLLENYTSRPR